MQELHLLGQFHHIVAPSSLMSAYQFHDCMKIKAIAALLSCVSKPTGLSGTSCIGTDHQVHTAEQCRTQKDSIWAALKGEVV